MPPGLPAICAGVQTVALDTCHELLCVLGMYGDGAYSGFMRQAIDRRPVCAAIEGLVQSTLCRRVDHIGIQRIHSQVNQWLAGHVCIVGEFPRRPPIAGHMNAVSPQARPFRTDYTDRRIC